MVGGFDGRPFFIQLLLFRSFDAIRSFQLRPYAALLDGPPSFWHQNVWTRSRAEQDREAGYSKSGTVTFDDTFFVNMVQQRRLASLSHLSVGINALAGSPCCFL